MDFLAISCRLLFTRRCSLPSDQPNKDRHLRQVYRSRVAERAVKLGAFNTNFLDEGMCAMTGFECWSIDSARLLIELLGDEDKREMQQRYLYFNTRKQQFELSDYLRKLNKSYAEVLAKAVKDRVSLVREAQRTWIKHRDDGAKFYVSLFPAAEKERRRLQFLCDVTAARIDTQPGEAWEL